MEDIFVVKNIGLENYLEYWVENQNLIDKNALSILEENDSDFIESIISIKKEEKLGFQYNIAYKATLKKFLMQPMGKEEILKVFRAFLNVMKFMGDNEINERYLLLDLNFIFVDFMTHELSFICIPADDKKIIVNSIAKFLREVLLDISYKKEENILYIAELMVFLSQKKKVDVSAFESLIGRLENEEDAKQNQTSTMPRHNTLSFSQSTAKQETLSFTNIISKQKGIITENHMEVQEKKTYSPKPINLDLARPVSGSLIGENGGFKEANDATTVLTAGNDMVQPPKPCLVRLINKEKIYIDKDIFKIGKSAVDVDYQIKDNQAISRVHAIIQKKNGVCYLSDNDSTNNTYINGALLKGEKEQMLLKGMKIAFADEEFIYELT